MFKQKKQFIYRCLQHAFYFPVILTALIIALFLSSAVHAENWYVKPSAEVPVRSGQGTEYKILAVVPDGLAVEIVEENDPWVKIRTPGGTEGWMLKRYLSNDPPLTGMVDILKSQKAELESSQEEVSRKYDELLSAYTELEQEYNSNLAARDDFENKYETLKEDTANVITIKKNLEDATRQANEAREKLAAVEQENENLKNNIAVKWFLAGGLVLLVGLIMGLMTGRTRKRKSSLY